MRIQTLISTMNKVEYNKLIEQMNVQTDAIIINQCNQNKLECLQHNDNNIKCFSFNERGVGLSRNNALMRADADICIFADEDVEYVDGYKKIIIEAFEKRPDADIIVFNVPSKNKERPTYIIKDNKRVKWYNCLRYGAVKIAVRTRKIHNANISFSLLFGGGAKYGSGEDSLFIVECMKKKLKIYTDNSIIGFVSQEDSSWFSGYNDKYFKDKGALFSCISKRYFFILCMQFIIRHKKTFGTQKSIMQIYELMRKGAREFEQIK